MDFKQDLDHKGFDKADRARIESLKLAQILNLDVAQFPQFRSDPAFTWQRDGSRYSLHAMQEAIKHGHLNLSDFRRVMDFGSGGGGPTFMLNEICNIAGGSVEALETNPTQLAQLRKVLPKIIVHTEDGLDILHSLHGGISLITAFTFGPDDNGGLFVQLARASYQALSAQGKLVLFSDKNTFATIQKRLHDSGVNQQAILIPQTHAGDTYKFSPATLILSKEGCALTQ